MGDVSPLAVVEIARNRDATLPEIQEESSAPPEADSHNPPAAPRGRDRGSLSVSARSWAPGDAELSRCEHREGHSDGRFNPTRKVRTPGAQGGKTAALRSFPGKPGFDSWAISVVYTSPSGMRGRDGAHAALRNAGSLALWLRTKMGVLWTVWKAGNV